MSDVAQFALPDFATLRQKARYVKNERTKSHKDKVKINGLQAWNQAPTQRYAEWVKEQHKRWKKKPRRGRPVSWGTWYIFTFPDQTNLAPAEKQQYAQELIDNLDAGSSGIMVWHDKFLTKAHDLNLLVSPFAREGELLRPRRDSGICEYDRLQCVSDQLVERLNQQRAISQILPIETISEVQERERLQKKRKTVAEVLAESPQLKSLLTDEDHGQQHTLDKYRAQLEQSLKDAGHAVASWDPRTWKAAIQRPGLPEPQTFEMVHILGEAVELIRVQQRSRPQSVVNRPAPVSPPPVAHEPGKSELPIADVFAALTRRTNRRRLRNETDLRRRLETGGLEVCFHADEPLGLEDKFLIQDKKRRSLIVQRRDLLMAAQCHLLRQQFYQETTSAQEKRFCLTFSTLAVEPPPAAYPEQRCYKLSAESDFWAAAFKELDSDSLRRKWETAIESTAAIESIAERVQEIRQQLDNQDVSAWTQFCLFVAHCPEATDIITRHLMPRFQTSSEFKEKRHLALETRSKQHEPPAAQQGPMPMR